MKIQLTILVLFVSCFMMAQEPEEYKTIIGGKQSGGYGAMGAGYSLIDESDAFVFHARGGLIMNHFVSLGLGGTGFISQYRMDDNLNLSASFTGGYGGGYLEFILFGRSPVHLSFPFFGGLGGATYSTWENEGTEYERLNYIDKFSTYLVFEPGVELEFNLSKFMRMAAFFNIRYTTDLDISTSNTSGTSVSVVNPEALDSYSGGLIFKFGKF